MIERAHPLGNLQSLDNVKLGRLVLDTTNPGREFHDPLLGRPSPNEYTILHHENVKKCQTFSKRTKLRSYLGKLFSVSSEIQRGNVTTLNAPRSATHELQNSITWFQTVCEGIKTREWIGDNVMDGRDMYLIVGYLTVQDARLLREVVSRTARGMDTELPINSPVITTAETGFTPGAQFLRNTNHGSRIAFDAPGDQVFAVQYQKIQCKWFSNRRVDNLSLEKHPRWKHSTEWRGGPDESDEEDMLEARLMGDSDLEMEEGDEDIRETALADKSDVEMSDEEGTSDPEDLSGGGAPVYSGVVVAVTESINDDGQGSQRKRKRESLPKSRFDKSKNPGGERLLKILKNKQNKSGAALLERRPRKRSKKNRARRTERGERRSRGSWS